MAKNKQSFPEKLLRWWLAGPIHLYRQLVVKTSARYKSAAQQDRTVGDFVTNGFKHISYGAIWLAIIPFGYYLALSFVLQASIIFGLGTMGYLGFTQKTSPVVAVGIGMGVCIASAVLAFNVFSLVAPLAIFIFAVKGLGELAFGVFDLCVGLIPPLHQKLHGYRIELTEACDFEPIEMSQTIEYACDVLPALAKDAENNVDEIIKQTTAMHNKLICRQEQYQPTNVETSTEKSQYPSLMRALKACKAGKSATLNTLKDNVKDYVTLFSEPMKAAKKEFESKKQAFDKTRSLKAG